MDKSRPEIVCLCGSTRFADEFRKANRDLTLEGKIVLSVGFFVHDKSEQDFLTVEVKEKLDALHLEKIRLSDGIFVLNVNGYIGTSTRRELAFAIAKQKKVVFLEHRLGEEFMENNSHELGKIVASFVAE